MTEIMFENEMKRRDKIDKIHFMLHFISLLVILIMAIVFVTYISQYDIISYDNTNGGSVNINAGAQGEVNVENNAK